MEPFDEAGEALLTSHFATFREDTLAGVRPPGALSARRRSGARRRHLRLAVFATAVVAVLAGAGGAVAVLDHPGRRAAQAGTDGSPSPSVSPPDKYAGGTAAPGVNDGHGPIGTAAPDSPPDGPVPPGFQFVSVTFISRTAAWALGYAPCILKHQWSQCPAVVRSRDGGRTWAGLPAPGGAAFSGDLRFANPRDGWITVRTPIIVTEPGGAAGTLYATHDGGATWHAVEVSGAVRVETGGGRVWVTTGPRYAVYSAPIATDSFAKIADTTGIELAAHGAYAYNYGAGTDLTVLKNGTVTHRRLPCATGYQHHAVLAAAADLSLAVVCGGPAEAGIQLKQAFTSIDGGVTWTPAGTPDQAGFPVSLAATNSSLFLAGMGMPIRATRDAGRSWPVALPDAGSGFGYVGFTDNTHGVALPFAPSPQIYLTTDGGDTWNPYRAN